MLQNSMDSKAGTCVVKKAYSQSHSLQKKTSYCNNGSDSTHRGGVTLLLQTTATTQTTIIMNNYMDHRLLQNAQI